MNDPYCIPGTDCLANNLGITDAAQLNAVEAQLVSIRDVQISRTTIPGSYGTVHLFRFHELLFRDVYSWAGEARTVDIASQAFTSAAGASSKTRSPRFSIG